MDASTADMSISMEEVNLGTPKSQKSQPSRRRPRVSTGNPEAASQRRARSKLRVDDAIQLFRPTNTVTVPTSPLTRAARNNALVAPRSPRNIFACAGEEDEDDCDEDCDMEDDDIDSFKSTLTSSGGEKGRQMHSNDSL